MLKTKLLLFSFMVGTFGDCIYTWIQNRQMAADPTISTDKYRALAAMNVVRIPSNLLGYWLPVSLSARMLTPFARSLTRLHPQAAEAAGMLREILGLLCGIPFNEIFKPLLMTALYKRSEHSISNLRGLPAFLMGIVSKPAGKVLASSTDTKTPEPKPDSL